MCRFEAKAKIDKWSISSDVNSCMKLQYWNRLWIVQEVFLARIAFVVVGERLVDFRQFVELVLWTAGHFNGVFDASQ